MTARLLLEFLILEPDLEGLGLPRILRGLGCPVESVTDPTEALEHLRSGGGNVLILSIRLGNRFQEELRAIRAQAPELEVVGVVSDQDTGEIAEALWASELLSRSWLPGALPALIDRLSLRERLARERQGFRRHLDVHGARGIATGRRGTMARIRRLTRKVADSPRTTILIEGEPGTGKRLLARAIHRRSPRRDGPFLSVECSAFSGEELDLGLFGQASGSTGGPADRVVGLAELAHGGTLCLAEVALLPRGSQARLLPLLESQTLRRRGGTHDIDSDVRVIATSSRDLQSEVGRRRFREDLYYLLQVVPIRIPPLRERIEEIPALATGFAARFARLLGRPAPTLTPEALEVLTGYPWPGNIRELKVTVERGVLQGTPGQPLGPMELHPPGLPPRIAPEGRLATQDSLDFAETLDDLARDLLNQALEVSGGNKTEAARRLRIPRHVLRYQLGRLGLD